jgi:hypothetical protein
MPSEATRVSMDELAACSTPTIGSSSVLRNESEYTCNNANEKKEKKKNKSIKKRKERKNFAKSLGL